jgi:hypothetical protein
LVASQLDVHLDGYTAGPLAIELASDFGSLPSCNHAS